MAHASKSALQLTVLALALSSIGAQADTITWANDASGNWTLPINWAPIGLPTNSSDVVISVTGVKTITHDVGNDTINTLSFEAGTPNPNAALVVTNTAAGSSSLTVTSGGTNGGVIRADNGTVNFTGGTFVNANGTLNALNGGVISFQNATLQGGTLSTDASTAIHFGNASTLDGATSGAITNNGAIQTNPSASVYGKGTITNNGTIVVGANSYLRMLGSDNMTLNGAGSLTLATDPNFGSRSQLFTDNGTITNGANHTINGVGDFGNGSTTIVNQGTVTANVSGGTLTIDPRGGTRDTVGLTNTGTLRAENGGQLYLQNGTYNNVSGTIQARTGSQVYLNAADIQGGTLATVGTGSIIAQAGAVLDGVTAGTLNNTGALTLANSTTVYVLGTINNTGSIKVGPNTDFRAIGSDAITFTGNGTVTLASDANIGSSSQLYTDNNTLITNGAGHTIQGYGNFGRGSSVILNNGSVLANDPTGPLNVNVGGNTFTNNGVFRADGSTLNLQQGTFVNNTTIGATNGGTVNITGGATVIQGGTLSTDSGSHTYIGGSARLDGTTNGMITNIGTLTENQSSVVYVNGTINNKGSIIIGANSDLRATGSDAINFTGNGTVTLASITNFGSASQLYTDNNTLITNGAGHTIQGYGNLGRGSSVILNNGSVLANDPTGPLNVNVGGNTFTNNGVFRADGSTLNLQQGTFVNNTTIGATNNGTVNISGGATVIQGGTLSIASGSSMTIGGSATLDGTAASNGPITIAGTLTENQSTTTYVRGTINNNGSIIVGANSDLRAIGSDVINLTGNGTITLASIANFGSPSQLYTDNSTLITNGANHTIQGYGNLGRGSSVILNNGAVLANDPTGPLNVNVGGNTFTNNGVFRADGSTLNLQQGTFVNNTTIGAINNGVVNITGGATVIQGGILSTASGGSMTITGGARLDGTTNGTLTNAANLTESQSTTIYANGTINNTGAITIGANSDFRATGSDSINFTGNGNVTLATITNFGSPSQLYTDNGTITNGADHTIQGAGNVGRASTVISNSGIINANASGQTLNLSTVGPVSNLSTGVLQASNGGTLNIAQAVTGTGTIRSDSGGTVVLNQPAQVGQLINNAHLEIGDYTVTVSSDYNNANFGTGNSFNRHAGVTSYGTPLTAAANNTSIVASGNVAQAVTGANVTGGTSDSPTLTIGNVRVGGTTYNYQVANTGTDGPSIRGALQTNVNGGNITDSRLSGSGVTASNYGPVATGANSGNLGVTFTASTAGALAPLTGQAVHIANNFDNVSEQTLGIVLGSGAAAYNVAQPNVPTTVNLGNVHVGTSASQGVTIGNTNISPAGYQEGLDVSVGTRSAGATGTGSISNLAAGSTSNNVVVGLSNIGAGNRSGTVALNLASNGSTTSGLDTLVLAPATVTVNATGYNLASASVTPSPIVFTNAHVGDTRSQALAVANTGPAGAYTEGLTASIGSASGTGVVGTGAPTGLIAAQTSSTALGVKLDTTSAGAKTGSVSVNLNSDGTGTSGLGTTALASQSVTVSGNVYNLASSSTIGTINFGLHHVGDGTITQNVSVTNTAAGGNYSEGLDTSFGAVTGTGAGKISTSGVVTNLAAQSTDSSTLKVSLDTSQVGTVNGNVRVIQASNGTISGLANTALPDQNPAVTADVQASGMTVRYAVGQINNAPVSFGAVRINTAQNQALSITNAVPNDGFSESLVAGIAGTSGKATGSGGFGPPTSVPSLAASATDTTHVIVGLDTSAAGHQTGSVSVNFKSDGTMFAGGTITDRGNTAVNVTGDVYRLASPTVAGTPITVAARVGGTGPTTSIAVTNTSPDVYTEGLSVSRGATSTGFTSSGSVTNLVAGGSSSAIGVTLNTATAGTFTGTQALNYVSTGAGTDNAADLAIGSGSVALNGKVYTPAVAQNNTPSVNFGIVHVGDTVTAQSVSVTNAAANTALNDVLVGSAVGATGPFTASGTLGAGLAAQQTSTNALQVGLNTTTAGNYSGSATFSAASHDSDLSDAALANLAVSLVGQVNNYASDTFSKTGGAGTLTRSGSTFVLDYGTLAQNSGTVTSSLVATNDATGPADALSGSFEFLDSADFGESGFAAFMNLAAGMSDGPLSFSFNTATVGTFMDSIILHGVGSNASGYSGMIGDIELIVRGTVNAAVVTPPDGNVPEPDSLLLLGLGLPLLFLRRGRKQRMH